MEFQQNTNFHLIPWVNNFESYDLLFCPCFRTVFYFRMCIFIFSSKFFFFFFNDVSFAVDISQKFWRFSHSHCCTDAVSFFIPFRLSLWCPRVWRHFASALVSGGTACTVFMPWFAAQQFAGSLRRIVKLRRGMRKTTDHPHFESQHTGTPLRASPLFA